MCHQPSPSEVEGNTNLHFDNSLTTCYQVGGGTCGKNMELDIDWGEPEVSSLPLRIPRYEMKRTSSFDIEKKRQIALVRRNQRMIARQAGFLPPRSVYTAPANLYAPRGTGATELKCVDTQGSVTSPFNTIGLVTLVLNPPVEGASFYNRIGRRIRMKSLHINGWIQPSGGNAAAVPPQYARILVLYDRQANGALPAGSDILQAYNAAGGTSNTFIDGLNMNNRDRFTILRDRKVVLPALGVMGATATSQTNLDPDPNLKKSLNYQEFIKLKGLETHFKASAGGVGDISTGALLMMTITYQDANATAAWQLQYGARLKFYD